MTILLAADVSINKILGGAERALFEIAMFLKNKGHKVIILTRRLNEHKDSYEYIHGVHEFRYDVDQSHPLSFIYSTLSNAQQVYRTIAKNNKIDCINFHQPFCALALNLCEQTKNIRKVYTCHSLSFEEFLSRHKNDRKNLAFYLSVWMRRFMEWFSLMNSDDIIVLSQFTKNKLTQTHRISADKIHIIPSGVNINQFTPYDQKDLLRDHFYVPQGHWVLFTARNLVNRMGLDNLIKASSVLVKKNIPVYLIIAGQGPLREYLEQLVKELRLEDHVRFTGFIPDEDLVKHYQLADFFVLPTIELEGFGLVTVEAMACATPVMATPIGGTVEILSSFRPPCLFKDCSPQSMAEFMIEKYTTYKESPDDYQKLCQKSREYVKEHYDWNKNAAHIEKLLANE